MHMSVHRVRADGGTIFWCRVGRGISVSLSVSTDRRWGPTSLVDTRTPAARDVEAHAQSTRPSAWWAAADGAFAHAGAALLRALVLPVHGLE